MKLKNLIPLPKTEKIDHHLPVARKLALMEKNKTIIEIGNIEISRTIRLEIWDKLFNAE